MEVKVKRDTSISSPKKVAVVIDFPSKNQRENTTSSRATHTTAEGKTLEAYLNHADSLKW